MSSSFRQSATSFSASPKGEKNTMAPPPLAGDDQNKLAAIMARQRQAAEGGEDVEEVTVETFEEVVEEDTENGDVVEEVIDDGNEDGEEEDGDDGEGDDEDVGDHDDPGDDLDDIDDETEQNDGADDDDNPPELEASGSEMSIEEFNKDDPNAAPALEPEDEEEEEEEYDEEDDEGMGTPPVDLDEEYDDADELEDVEPEVDDETPEDGYGEAAYGTEDYDQGDQNGQAYGQYGHDQYAEQGEAEQYEEDPAYGAAAYAQSGYGGQGYDEQFQDEELANTRGVQPVAYDPRVSKARTVDSMDEYRLCFCLSVACLFLLLALGGAVTVLVLWLQDDEETRTVVVTPGPAGTPAPSGSPTPTVSPVPGEPTASPVAQPPAPAPKTASLLLTVQDSDTEKTIGASVAMAGEFIAIGDPSSNGGQVLTFVRQGDSVDIEERAVVISDGTTEEFGMTVDMAVDNGNPTVLVGAPITEATVNVDGTSVTNSYGAAYYLTFDGNEWNEIGGTIRGGLGVTETAGLFGGAVAMATDIPRFSIAAYSSSDMTTRNSGKVYTYTFSGTSWQTIGTVIKGSAESFTGSSLDMSADGASLIVGAPGEASGNGQVAVYEWNGSDWDEVFTDSSFSGASLGTALEFMNSDASRFVVGGPTANSGEGVVVVYEASTSGNAEFSQLGSPITGDTGEGIGSCVCGQGDLVGFGTNTGGFLVYEYGNNAWTRVASQSVGAPPLDCAFSENGNTVTIGTGEDVRVYSLS